MSKLRVLGLLAGVLLLSGCMLFGPFGPVILYEEDFNSDTNWYQGESENKKWWIEDGEYHLLIKTEGISIYSWNTTIGQLSNFQLDVDARQIAGPDDNGYGVHFRQVDGDNYYRFRISGDGWARFDKQLNGSFVVIRDWERSDLIHQGNATNHITVIANGSLFTFLINGTEDFSATDSSFDSGAAGLVGILLDFPAPARFAFDNFVITELE